MANFAAISGSSILVGTESSPGTLSGTLAPVLCEVAQPSVDFRAPVVESITQNSRVVLKNLGGQSTLEIKMPLMYASTAVRTASGDATSPPPSDALFRACGYAGTNAASKLTRTYTLNSTPAPCSIQFVLNSSVHEMVGCVGSAALAFEDSRFVVTFSMQGRLSKMFEGTTVTPPVPAQAYRPLTVDTLTISHKPASTFATLYSGNSIASLSLNQNANVVAADVVTEIAGKGLPCMIPVDQTEGELQVFPAAGSGTDETALQAAFNNGTELRVTAAMVSADSGVTGEVQCSGLKLTSVAFGDNNGLQVLTGAVARSSDIASGAFTIKFTTPTV